VGSRVTIHYPWHPLKGQRAEVLRRIRTGEGVSLEVRLNDGVVKRLPEWMAQADVCATMAVSEKPLCGMAALRELRAQLDAWARGAEVGSSSTIEATEEDCDPATGRQGSGAADVKAMAT